MTFEEINRKASFQNKMDYDRAVQCMIIEELQKMNENIKNLTKAIRKGVEELTDADFILD